MFYLSGRRLLSRVFQPAPSNAQSGPPSSLPGTKTSATKNPSGCRSQATRRRNRENPLRTGIHRARRDSMSQRMRPEGRPAATGKAGRAQREFPTEEPSRDHLEIGRQDAVDPRGRVPHGQFERRQRRNAPAPCNSLGIRHGRVRGHPGPVRGLRVAQSRPFQRPEKTRRTSPLVRRSPVLQRTLARGAKDSSPVTTK